MQTHEIEIRVRYQETDAQGRVHHANYLTWFELGRVELLRALGCSYRRLEDEGFFLVVAEVSVEYLRPAFFDDLLRLQATTVRAKGASIHHAYQVFRDRDTLARGASKIACIDRQNKITKLPAWLRLS